MSNLRTLKVKRNQSLFDVAIIAGRGPCRVIPTPGSPIVEFSVNVKSSPRWVYNYTTIDRFVINELPPPKTKHNGAPKINSEGLPVKGDASLWANGFFECPLYNLPHVLSFELRVPQVKTLLEFLGDSHKEMRLNDRAANLIGSNQIAILFDGIIHGMPSSRMIGFAKVSLEGKDVKEK
jgi:hypothetical protein